MCYTRSLQILISIEIQLVGRGPSSSCGNLNIDGKPWAHITHCYDWHMTGVRWTFHHSCFLSHKSTPFNSICLSCNNNFCNSCLAKPFRVASLVSGQAFHYQWVGDVILNHMGKVRQYPTTKHKKCNVLFFVKFSCEDKTYTLSPGKCTTHGYMRQAKYKGCAPFSVSLIYIYIYIYGKRWTKAEAHASYQPQLYGERNTNDESKSPGLCVSMTCELLMASNPIRCITHSHMYMTSK